MNLGSRGPVVIDTGVFGARLAPSGRGYSPRGIDRYLKADRQLSLLSLLPSWSTEQGWPTGVPTGSGGWSTRLAGQRSSGLDRISPRYMPRCGPGASGRDMAWARKNMKRIAGWRRQRCGFRSLWSPTIGSSPTSTTLSY